MSNWSEIIKGAESEYATFLHALPMPRAAQKDQLREILWANHECEFGRQYGFNEINDPDDFRDRVPTQSYADFSHDIQRMTRGARDVLCSSSVCAYEETGGSSGAAKLTPYTDEALTAFRRALLPWFTDLIQSRPGISDGRAYFTLSPVTRASRTTPDGTPIGLSSEADYLGQSLAPHLMALSVVPPALAGVTDMDTWRYLTLRFLLDAEDLTLISVWSPTFLFPLLEVLLKNGEQLVKDVAVGSVYDLPDKYKSLTMDFTPKPKRAKVIARALTNSVPDTRLLWPQLDTISCWTDAGSRRFIPHLRDLFPHAFVQGKGLLATEGVVTIPLVGHKYPVLALHSGFFEFLDVCGVSHLCDELENDEIYRILLTTHGGLYRYDLGDRVRVRGWIEETPMLEFVGRAGPVGDLCGEKLTEDFVAAQVVRISGFSMLAPVLAPSPHYILFLDQNEHTETAAHELASSLDTALAENPQYQYARRLGQLGMVRPRLISKPLERYMLDALRRGQQLGDIKPPVFRTETDWVQRFAMV